MSPFLAHGLGRADEKRRRRGPGHADETRRRRRDRGSATIQHVFILPALFTLMFVFVQGAMYYQGRAIAIAAAEEGARVAAAEGGTAGAGAAAATRYVANTTVGLSGTSATGTRTVDRVAVTVTTYTVSLIPNWQPKVTQTARLPVERLTTG